MQSGSHKTDHCLATGGFSLVAMMTVLAVIMGLAGLVAPLMTDKVDQARKECARADLDRIAAAIQAYIEDTLTYPTGTCGAATYHFLFSEGTLPLGNPLASGPGLTLHELLDSGDYGGAGWRGPYLGSITHDPWGNAYLVNCHGYFQGAERIFILSPGPDHTVDTAPTACSARGDDLLLLIDG